MGMTIAEKIIARAAGVESVRPGDIHTVEVDRLMSNDGTTHLTIDMYNTKLKHPHIADVSKLVWIVDHNVPSDSPKTAASQKKMRDFAKENNIDIEIAQVRISEIASNLPADLIVTTSKVKRDFGVPLITGMPFVSGLGVDKTKAKILEVLNK